MSLGSVRSLFRPFEMELHGCAHWHPPYTTLAIRQLTFVLFFSGTQLHSFWQRDANLRTAQPTHGSKSDKGQAEASFATAESL